MAPELESRDTVVPFTTMRKIIAEHLMHSLATTAHVSAAVEVDFERVERVRQSAQDEWRAHEGFPLNYLPFVGRAVCDAIDEFPVVNASIDGTNIVLHGAVHLAIAVDLNFEGLVTPVIRDADGKRLRAIAREIKDLAERARAKRLSLDLLQGGTFTITNPGPFGTYITLPIINAPQVAILSTDGIQKRPVVVEGPNGEDVIAVHHMGMLALTWDHRAFDGAYAAAFLRRVKQIIETHDWEVELD
jgi:pyruvate dehydrogenase E2 component (dihydrolipoamide acetyltransferase)